MLCAKKTACVYSQRRCWWWKVRERAACAISWRYSCLRGQTQTECCARWARRARLMKSGWWNSRLRFVALRTACSARSPPRGQTHKRCNRGQCGVHATPRTHTARHPRVENWNLDRLSSPSYLNAATCGGFHQFRIYTETTRARACTWNTFCFLYIFIGKCLYAIWLYVRCAATVRCLTALQCTLLLSQSKKPLDQRKRTCC